MILEMVKSEGIAHRSYFLGNAGRAVVIDPRRDIEIYVSLAETNGLNITHIFETHRNEDYLIGSLELQQAAGGEIYHGKNLDFEYGNPVGENHKFKLGNLELEVLETPGHTVESISLVLRDVDVSSAAQMAFTGDLIFAGETGRIDFYGRENRPKMAGLLYDSIHKIFALGDNVVLCPAHGAGSVCGADIREQEYTTVGYEKRTNPQLGLSKYEFMEVKASEELYYPPYFRKMEELNQKGPPILYRLPVLKSILPTQLKELQKQGVQILDIRSPTSFSGGHIPGSLNIWQDGVPAFAGWFLNYQDPWILVSYQNESIDSVRRSLVRLGFNNLCGYLSGGFPSWYLHAEEVEKMEQWTVQQLKKHQFDSDFYLLDVRKPEDREKGYIEGSKHIYAGLVPEEMDKIPRNQKIVVYCDSGNKSAILASYLQKKGYHDVASVLGSMNAWLKAGYPVFKD